MAYQTLTMDEKKRMLKARVYRFYMHVIQSAIFWMLIGFVVSTLMMNSVLVTVFTQFGELAVCR